MQRVQSKAIQRNLASTGVKVLLCFQVIAMILMLASGVNAGLAKSILNHLPVVVSTVIIAASVHAISNGNETRAHSILNFGVLFVGLSALLAIRAM